MDSVSLLQAGSALLLNIGFAWLVGAWFARHWMRSSGVGTDDFEPALRKLDLAAAGVSVASSASALLAATAVMGGIGLREACPMFWTMVSSTDYGRAGCVTILAMTVLLFVRLAGRVGHGINIAIAALLAIFAVTRASMGHAGEDGFWTVALAVEAVHFSAIGLWTGAVMVSGWFVLNGARVRTFAAHASGRYLAMMSQAAMLAVVGIIGTGVYSAWHRVGTTEHLLHTSYGMTLLAKVGLVMVAIALGGYNKFVGLPAASRSPCGLGLVRAILRVETFLLLGALFAAAALTSQQPP
ncbi:MAG: CopD family protein, partial [Pseudomonadota bacterium]|nr:CopD family protein [Pseudomonadota bacterium]